MANRWGNKGNSDRLYFWGSQITADGDWSHEIKRCLLLRRKAMTNLDSILKSRDITLSAKVCLVNAMVFPAVMYGLWELDHKEGWVLKNWCFWIMLLLLRVLWTARRSNQSIIKEINSEYSLAGSILKLKLQYFGHLMWRADSLEKTHARKDRRSGQQRMRCLNGIPDSMDMSLSKI